MTSRRRARGRWESSRSAVRLGWRRSSGDGSRRPRGRASLRWPWERLSHEPSHRATLSGFEPGRTLLLSRLSERGADRNRTGVHGFAGRAADTPESRFSVLESQVAAMWCNCSSSVTSVAAQAAMSSFDLLLSWVERSFSDSDGEAEMAHRLLGQVAAADEPFVSLKASVLSSGPCWRWSASARVVGSGLLRSLSALGSAHVVGCSCPGFSDRLWASGGQTNGGACRGRIGARCGGAAGLERLVAGEDVPGGDQDLARDGGLGGVGLAVAALGVGVEPVPGVGRAARPAGRLRRRPSAACRGRPWRCRPVRELCPDCLIVGVRPE